MYAPEEDLWLVVPFDLLRGKVLKAQRRIECRADGVQIWLLCVCLKEARSKQNPHTPVRVTRVVFAHWVTLSTIGTERARRGEKLAQGYTATATPPRRFGKKDTHHFSRSCFFTRLLDVQRARLKANTHRHSRSAHEQTTQLLGAQEEKKKEKKENRKENETRTHKHTLSLSLSRT